MNLFKAVRTQVTARQAAERYGLEVSRNGMAICPFHDDHTPSLKLDGRFHCFGCGADGDVIDFAAKMFGLTAVEAAKKLADDFGISYDEPKKRGRPRKNTPPADEIDTPPASPLGIAPDGKLDETAVCREILRERPIICCNGRFFTEDGMMADEAPLRNDIFQRIAPYIRTKVAAKVDNIVDALRVMCWAEPPEPQTDRIHVANGTLFLDGTFSEEKEICLNRLPVKYNPDAESPWTWLVFLSDLLNEDDIRTVQEYLGYLLIPSTKAQKMMMIIGQGGEGKSRIGLVLRKILGDAMYSGSLQKIETSKFARADLQYRLAMVDDDMKMSALPSTNYIKSIVTAEDKMDLEEKNRQSYQGLLYSRFLCFSNGSLTALYDHSFGFYRRQIAIQVKERDPNRKDDPYLIEKLYAEAEGIFLWMFAGLQRLIQNDFRFTVSEKAKENIAENMEESNNVSGFLASEGYIQYRAEAFISTRRLYDLYMLWCEDNAVKPLSMRTFSTGLAQQSQQYRLEYSNKISIGMGRFARGYIGVTEASA